MKLLQRYIYSFFLIVATISVVSCNDNDTFSADYSSLLSFEGSDTLSLDTIFSNVASPHKQKVVHNNTGDGILISTIRQAGANQTGFRVNVNGSYLSDATGYTIHDMELRKGDSLRIFLEMTSRQGQDTLPRLLKDSLIFTLESGRQQVLHLNAWSWDAKILRNYVASKNDTLRNEHGMPIVVFGNIKVDTLHTLTIDPGTTIYFHSKSGIDVYGTLLVNGQKDKEVTFRSDRLDRMVSNLMYDNNPGQWGGIRLHESSYGNVVDFCDIHAGTTAFECDSAKDNNSSKLKLLHSTIHNQKGSGIEAENCNITIENSQISNACAYCLCFLGGNIDINSSTIAQYYPFDANRGPALYFANAVDSTAYPMTMIVKNSIIKGYADDEIWWSKGTLNKPVNARFTDCLLRTAHPEDDDSLMFQSSILENVEDTLTNPQNSFVLFDTDFFFYDFTPKEGSQAIGAANPLNCEFDDRKGKIRSTTKPDIGCFETDK